jgi:hypothetical protein
VSSERELRVATARFLREARRRDPEHYHQVAALYPVLSTFQIDRRKEREVELYEDDEHEHEDRSYRGDPVARQIYRDWLAAAFQEAA